MASQQYQILGASADKQGLHRALKAAGVEDESGLFARIIPDQSGADDFASFLHCDGAGTKTIVAYLRYRETGDIRVFRPLAHDALVMNLDDCYCLGPIQALALANTIARNARIIPDEAVQEIVDEYRLLSEKLRDLGISITLSGGETADCGDTVRTLVVDAVISGRIRQDQIVSTQNISAGDAIVGLSSTGRTSYESETNSGIGSNGLTLARHAMLPIFYAQKYPEVVDSGLDHEIIYGGTLRLEDPLPGSELTVGQALASPTRSYAPLLLKLFPTLGKDLHALIHCTGGGQTKVLRFGKNKRYRKNALFPVPPIFAQIQQQADTSWKEMYQVFNMGHRLEMYVPESKVSTIIDTARSFGIEAQQIGIVEDLPEGSKNQVLIESPHGTFEYEATS